MAPRPEPANARERVEAAALALLAIAPAAPYGLALLRGVPRFSMFGDYAILEMVTRFVWSGRTLVGPYSRFGFSHPGPLYFYLLAPVYSLLGERSVGIFAGALLINLAAIATIVVAARRFGSRVHAAAAILTVWAWWSAFGNICDNPWNPLVIALPLVAYLVLAAFFAQGASLAACPAAFFGALVAQTHVAAVTTVAGVGAATTAAFLLARRRVGLGRRERRHLSIALGILLVTSVPPVIEQVIAPGHGNLRKLASFFLDRPEPLHPWSIALHDWATATSWLPDRVLDATLGSDRGVPLPMRWDAIPPTLSRTARTLAWIHVGSLIAGGVLCWCRRDRRSATLLAVGAGAEGIAISTLRGIVGEHFHYLVFWAAAGNAVAWLGLLSALGNAASDALRRRTDAARRIAFAAFSTGAFGAWAATAWLQCVWISRNVPTALARDEVRDVYAALLGRLRREGDSPVVHLDGAWSVATVFVLELSNDGIPAYHVERERWIFGRPPTSDEAPRPLLHVYLQEPDLPLKVARCLEPFARSGNVEVFVSRSDVELCP